jgi:hypothetical protein
MKQNDKRLIFKEDIYNTIELNDTFIENIKEKIKIFFEIDARSLNLIKMEFERIYSILK